MEKQKELKRYSKNFMDELKKYLNKDVFVRAVAHPAKSNGAVLEFTLTKKRVSKSASISVEPSEKNLAEILTHSVKQRAFGGNLTRFKFSGTNFVADGNRIIVIKGDDDQDDWSNKSAAEDARRVVTPKEGAASATR